MSTAPRVLRDGLPGMRASGRELTEGRFATSARGPDVAVVLRMLDDALAAELVCVMRYRQHYYSAQGFLAEVIKAEFLAHSHSEQAHADMIAARMVQLGGSPDFNPAGLVARAHIPFGKADSLLEMISENLAAEHAAIDSYRRIIQYLQEDDSTTRIMLEQILAVEEEHAADLAGILKNARADFAERR